MKLKFFILLFLFSSLLTIAQSGICLTPTNNLTALTNPRSMVAALLNNDAFIDIAIANHGSNNVSVYMGNGNGTFGAPVSYTMGQNPRIAKADFNNDGFIDIATANEGSGTSPELSVRLNNGNGTFGAVINYTAGTLSGFNMPQHLVCKDFNNDSRIDVALINMNGAGLSVFLGTPSGTLGPCTNYTIGTAGVYMISDYFNNDSYADLAISSGSNILVFMGTFSGTFGAPIAYPFSTSTPFFLTSGDFNNDSYTDIASVGGLLLGSSSGTFALASTYNIPNSYGIASADFDVDGFLDLAVNTTSGSIIFLRGQGNGNFGNQTQIATTIYGAEMISPDLNGDGKMDLLGGNGLGSTAQVFLNKSFTLTASASSTTSCASYISTLTANSSVGNYTWSSGGNGNTTTVSVSTNTFYSVSSSNSVGCIATKTLALLINTPTIQLSASINAICPGATTTLSASGASSYTWSTNQSGASIIVSPSTNSSYVASGTNTMGCISSNTIFVGVNPNPTLVITASTLSLCGSGTINLNVTGANTYTWNTGSNSSSPVFSLSANTCYSVSGSNVSGCVSNNSICAVVLALPSLSISGSNSVCAGTSANLSAAGANTYSWSTGANTSTINILPSTSTSYSVIGIATTGCSNLAVHALSVNINCSDVWPGDANSDGIVNGSDVLELGLSFLNTGPPRSAISNSYFAQYCSNWTGTVSTGKNECHADCNGDGTINTSDTLAIFQNFSLTHSFRPAEEKSTFELKLIPEYPNYFLPGQWNHISIIAGDSVNSLSLYGIVFDIDFTSSAIQTDSIYLSYSSSFLNADAKNIEFRKAAFVNEKLHAADVKTAGIEVSGYGEIARFYFKAKSDQLNGSSMTLGLSQKLLMHVDRNTESFTANNLTLLANSDALGVTSIRGKKELTLFPNPSSDYFILSGAANKHYSYLLFDLKGQKMLEGMFTATKTISVSDIPAGVYVLKYVDGETSACIKMVIQK